MKTNKAFSLIELSIVILIIGIIIAGITQSSSLVSKMKLNTARSLTKSSPVPGIYGLSLWLETTSSESFTTSYDNNALISQWNDINPQVSVKSNAIATGSATPTYASNGINGLPSIKCDGVDDLISIPFGSSPFLQNSSPAIFNNFTIFLVAAPISTHQVDTQDNSSTAGTSGQKYVIGAIHGASTYGSSSAGVGVSLGTNGVTVYEHGGSYMPPIAVYNGSSGLVPSTIITVDYNNSTPSIYVNSKLVQTGLTSSKPTVFPSGQFCSGQYGLFDGSIGEVIVYNRRLVTEERDSVNKYLGQKWGIKLN